jgi:hypothetical protein
MFSMSYSSHHRADASADGIQLGFDLALPMVVASTSCKTERNFFSGGSTSVQRNGSGSLRVSSRIVLPSYFPAQKSDAPSR